jgi:hypothetical protein
MRVREVKGVGRGRFYGPQGAQRFYASVGHGTRMLGHLQSLRGSSVPCPCSACQA